MVEMIPVHPDNIQIRDRMRALREEAVAPLMESISRLGLRTPIVVRIEDEAMVDGEMCLGVPVLVAGRHRLEAIRRLGWQSVDVAIIDDETEARLWEISENLHRAELSAVERAEHIDEWRRLTVAKGAQVAPPSGGKQPGDRGHYKTAETLGVSRDTVRRAEKIASLPEDVRAQARDERWSQQRLLDMARDAEAAEARRRNRDADRLIAEQRLAEAVEWLGRRLSADDMHTLGDMLAGIAPALAKALMREGSL